MFNKSLVETIKTISKHHFINETTASRYRGRQQQRGRYSSTRKLAEDEKNDNKKNCRVNLCPELETIDHRR